MPASPLVLVSDNGGSFNPPNPSGLNIGAGHPVSITLQSPSGVSDWYLQIGLVSGSPPVVIPGTGTDDSSAAPTLAGVNSAGLVTSGPSATVTFTFTGAGTALLFSSTVAGGFGSITTTFALFGLTAKNLRVGPAGLTSEAGITAGWTGLTNAAIRLAGEGDVEFQEGGTNVVSSATANFTGAGVSVTNVGGVATVAIPGGISLENDGTGVANNPHTVLNLIHMVGADSGGGVATISSVPASASVAYGTTTSLDAHTWAVFVTASGSGATTVNAPTAAGVVGVGWAFAVTDSGAEAATNNITVSGNGVDIEDPNTPGSFSASVTLSVNSGSVVWMYDGTNWKIVWAFYPTGGGGGIAIENNGTPLANNPHTTLNLRHLAATDSGGGVALLTGVPNSVSAAYGTNTTIDNTTWQVLITGPSNPDGTFVTFPDVTTVDVGWVVTVTDDGGLAGAHNITISPDADGSAIEDPNAPGTLSSSIVISVNSGSVSWMYDGTDWKIVWAFYPTSGVSVQNNGSGISNNPHSTLNLLGWIRASDSGGGVSTLTALPTTSSAAYGSTTTLGASTTALIVGLSGSGATTVNAPPIGGVIGTAWTFAVLDSGGNCNGNQITVSGNGVNIEDPNTPGTFTSSVVMYINSGSVVWMYDGTHWKIVWAFYGPVNTGFATTTNTNATTVLTYPIASGRTMSFRARYTVNDNTSIGSSGAGEFRGFATNNGGLVSLNNTATPIALSTNGSSVTGKMPVNAVWQTNAGSVTFSITFSGSGNNVLVQVNGIAGTSTNTMKWRVDVEAAVI